MCSSDMVTGDKYTFVECEACADRGGLVLVDFACREESEGTTWVPLDIRQDYCAVITGVFYSDAYQAKEKITHAALESTSNAIPGLADLDPQLMQELGGAPGTVGPTKMPTKMPSPEVLAVAPTSAPSISSADLLDDILHQIEAQGEENSASVDNAAVQLQTTSEASARVGGGGGAVFGRVTGAAILVSMMSVVAVVVLVYRARRAKAKAKMPAQAPAQAQVLVSLSLVPTSASAI
jgi:hypothetical protein